MKRTFWLVVFVLGFAAFTALWGWWLMSGIVPDLEGIAPAVPRGHQATPKATPQERVERFRITAYCNCPKCCGKQPSNPAYGITASGTRADHALVAAPKSIPFGTRMRIPGYAGGQWVKVEDRGGAIKEGRLDLWFPAHQQALEWGVQTLDVKVEHTLEDRP